MKIAILMSTYNGHKYLNEQMDSLANQTLKDSMTIYVRDDGSSDDTIEIIEKWSKRIDIVLYKGKNVGPAKSFWELFMNPEIQADYYAFCDQDDVWDQDKLEKGIKALKKEKEEALWCSNCRIINSNGKVILKEMNAHEPDFSIISQLVCGTTQGCAMLLNNALRGYITEKKIDEIPMHDFVVLTYAVAKGEVIYDECPSFSYRVHGSNVVAKEGKSILKKVCSTVNYWFSEQHRNEVSKFAQRVYTDNKNYIDEETQNFIKELLSSKTSIIRRIKVINNPRCDSDNKKGLRSFRIRTLLGVI